MYILNRILYIKIKILLKNIEKALTTGKKGEDEKVSLAFIYICIIEARIVFLKLYLF